MALIPNWRDVWKFHSVWAAGLLSILLALQAVFANAGSDPKLQALTSSTTYSYIGLVVAVLIPVLRVLKKSNTPVRQLDLPSPIQGTTQQGKPVNSNNFASIFKALPQLIIGAEQVFGQSTGAEKSAIVAAAVAPLIPASSGTVSPNVQNWINMLVEAYNIAGLFKPAAPSSAVSATSSQQPSPANTLTQNLPSFLDQK